MSCGLQCVLDFVVGGLVGCVEYVFGVDQECV